VAELIDKTDGIQETIQSTRESTENTFGSIEAQIKNMNDQFFNQFI
jgi:hypothetical protein